MKKAILLTSLGVILIIATSVNAHEKVVVVPLVKKDSNPNVVDTSSGDATAYDITPGKKCWVDGVEITGTIDTRFTGSLIVNENDATIINERLFIPQGWAEDAERCKKAGIPDEFITRQPFPGPGLAIRIIGPINETDLALLRDADSIILEEIKNSGLYDKIWQTFAVLLPIKTVGVMGDERTYEKVIVLRAVESKDGMTADWVHLPYELLGKISNRIINEVKGVNRVVYDISSKPPSTIEWE